MIPQITHITPAPMRDGMRGGVRQHLHLLRAALAEGWELVQPIFARPQWSALDDRETALHFVLQREHTTQLLTVPETRAVQRFVRTRAWRVQRP